MKAWKFMLVGQLIALFSVLPAEAAGDDASAGFRVPRATIIAEYKTIGFMPIRVSSRVPNAEAVQARYEQLVTAKLQEAGFKVLPSTLMQEIRDRATATMGGLYDAETGDIDVDKSKAFNEFSQSEYFSKHAVDALLVVGIVNREAPTYYNVARWDGVVEDTTGATGISNFFGTVSAEGTTAALSVIIQMSDKQGKTLYQSAGGLQVLDYMRAGMTSVRHLRVDPASLMTDPARDERALAIALNPLLGVAVPKKFPKPKIAPEAPNESAASLRLPREKLLGDYNKIALAPLRLGKLQQRTIVMDRYRELLSAGLRKLGFELVDDQELGSLWAGEAAHAHGFYDPITGNLDQKKYDAARQRVRDGVAKSKGAKAFVFPEVDIRSAPFQAGMANWDGVKEMVTSSKSWLGTMFNPNAQYLGQMPALSLKISIVDVANQTLYEDYGGIQVAKRVVGGQLQDVPEPELFSNAANDSRAVDLALRAMSATPAVR